jgi:hypothetical protein
VSDVEAAEHLARFAMRDFERAAFVTRLAALAFGQVGHGVRRGAT